MSCPVVSEPKVDHAEIQRQDLSLYLTAGEHERYKRQWIGVSGVQIQQFSIVSVLLRDMKVVYVIAELAWQVHERSGLSLPLFQSADESRGERSVVYSMLRSRNWFL